MGYITLPAKTPSDTKKITFDFVSFLASGETLATATTVTATVWTGVDTTPSNVLLGTPTRSGTTVIQGVTGGNAGTVYKLRCQTNSSVTSQNYVLDGYMAVIDDSL